MNTLAENRPATDEFETIELGSIFEETKGIQFALPEDDSGVSNSRE